MGLPLSIGAFRGRVFLHRASRCRAVLLLRDRPEPVEARRGPVGSARKALPLLRLRHRDAWHRLHQGHHRLGGEGEEHVDDVHEDGEQQQRGQDKSRVHKDEEWPAQYSGGLRLPN